MGKGIQDLGNGLGYIYVTDPSGVIQRPYVNNAENARKVKLDGVMAASIGANRVGTSVITIDAPTGAGSIIGVDVNTAKITDVGKPIAYTGATTAIALAQDIVSAINSYDKGKGYPAHTATRINNVVYIFSDTASENGQTPILANTGNWTYTVDQDIEGGSDNSEVWDEAIGYNFYLDADYGTTQCSGGGIATPTSIANAVNITTFIVNIGLQSSIPKEIVTLSNDGLVSDRKALVSLIYIIGEGAANDDLDSIVLEGAAEGDRIILEGENDITINSGSGNIELQTSTYLLTGVSFLELIYFSSTGVWYELSRSTMALADDAVTTVKILDLNVTTAKMDDLAVTTGKIALLAIDDTLLAADSVITDKILDENVTVAKVETTLKTDLLVVPISWDANRKGDHKIILPFPCSITQVDVSSDDLIEATDDADANFKDNGGLSMGIVTFTGGDTIGTGYSVTPSANNTFTAGQILTITTTKTTAGGNAKASIKLLKA